MIIDKKYFGKWIATKNEQILASEETLKSLEKKIEPASDIYYTLIPKGLMAGGI